MPIHKFRKNLDLAHKASYTVSNVLITQIAALDRNNAYYAGIMLDAFAHLLCSK